MTDSDVSGGRNAAFSALLLALPFTLERNRDHFTVGPYEGPLGAFPFFRERAFGPQDDKTYELRLSSAVDLDGPFRESKVLRWNSDRFQTWSGLIAISPGDVVVTNESNFVRITVDRFSRLKEDDSDVSVCRDAWLSGQHQRAEKIARRICPQTWPVLI